MEAVEVAVNLYGGEAFEISLLSLPTLITIYTRKMRELLLIIFCILDLNTHTQVCKDLLFPDTSTDFVLLVSYNYYTGTCVIK